MPIFAVLALVLLLIYALGSSLWWRVAGIWYGSASFAWGMFFLALYLTWPILKALG